MRLVSVLAIVVLSSGLVTGAGCRYSVGEHLALQTTPKILKRGQASLQMESDFEMARQAIPGALKTVESFWLNAPDNPELTSILTEGYCQYGTAFVEDDWEIAKFKQDIDAIDYHNARATKIFTRCFNYALRTLGKKWQRDIFGTSEAIAKLIKGTPASKRFPMLFAGLALGSMINHNLTRIEMIAHLSTVKLIMARVLEIDKNKKGCPPLPARCSAKISHLALPHVAMGMIHTSSGRATGGNPEAGQAAFEKALELTGNRFLLARTLMAYRVGLANNDRKFFHDQLKQVLETPPSVWPEQRLANEVAHRKARRYLSQEKELFQ